MENRLIVIDTDVVIDFFGNVVPAAEVLSELIRRGQAALTSVSVFELYAGIEGRKRLRQIETFIQHLGVIPLDGIEAAAAGRIYTQLKLRGELIGTHDILIAGICIVNNLPLYTRNIDHFSKIKGLEMFVPTEFPKH
ncbi:MAG: hypothetical protein A2162_09890 [Deltaproteobacteria bacterium RBG_13_52_11b]|nr:MAG: hypothetical protein A2162_09890 [Deltaproteobacteria bacterium RBG_13_52_11b]